MGNYRAHLITLAPEPWREGPGRVQSHPGPALGTGLRKAEKVGPQVPPPGGQQDTS